MTDIDALSILKLDNSFSNIKLRDLIANIDNDVGYSFIESFINHDINYILNNRKKAWFNTCKRMIDSLSTCKFEDRQDYDNLSIFAFCCKLKNTRKTSFGINIYNENNRVMTIFFKDSSHDELNSLYGESNQLIKVGTWVKDIKPSIISINTTGLEGLIIDNVDKKSEEIHKSLTPMHKSYDNVQGNVITILDLVKYIERLKSIYVRKI